MIVLSHSFVGAKLWRLLALLILLLTTDDNQLRLSGVYFLPIQLSVTMLMFTAGSLLAAVANTKVRGWLGASAYSSERAEQ